MRRPGFAVVVGGLTRLVGPPAPTVVDGRSVDAAVVVLTGRSVDATVLTGRDVEVGALIVLTGRDVEAIAPAVLTGRDVEAGAPAVLTGRDVEGIDALDVTGVGRRVEVVWAPAGAGPNDAPTTVARAVTTTATTKGTTTTTGATTREDRANVGPTLCRNDRTGTQARATRAERPYTRELPLLRSDKSPWSVRASPA